MKQIIITTQVDDPLELASRLISMANNLFECGTLYRNYGRNDKAKFVSAVSEDSNIVSHKMTVKFGDVVDAGDGASLIMEPPKDKVAAAKAVPTYIDKHYIEGQW